MTVSGPLSHHQTGLVISRWCATTLVTALFLTHLFAIGLGGSVAKPASYAILIALPCLSALCCLWRAQLDRNGDGWLAVALAASLWAGGMAAGMSVDLFVTEPGDAPGISMLLYVLYGVPLIFTIASPAGDAWHIRLVDGVLALTLGVLFCAHTFVFASFLHASDEGFLAIRWMFDIENLYIAVFAAIRWRASENPSRRAFFATLSGFAWIYLIVAAITNHLASDTDFGSPADLIIGLPFLWFIQRVLRQRTPRPSVPNETLRLAVQAGSPLALPASLLIVSATLYFRSPVFALFGFVAALLGYGLRSVLVQMRAIAEQSRLDRVARCDALTGLPNRREFDSVLDREWNRARRSGSTLAVLVIDIDHFKLLNDGLGHLAGDDRLRAVARELADCATRSVDLVARYGGEEFVAILPEASEETAVALAEKMRKAIENRGMPTPAPLGVVTVCIGLICTKVDGNRTAADLVAAADAALYEAKRSGRNRVEVARLVPQS